MTLQYDPELRPICKNIELKFFFFHLYKTLGSTFLAFESKLRNIRNILVGKQYKSRIRRWILQKSKISHFLYFHSLLNTQL